MKHRLFIVEGLPCTGKSTVSAYVADLLKKYHAVNFVDEGTGNHPADYEFHALAPAGLLSENAQIVPLAQFSGEMFDKLLQYKIYDFLSWETEQPLMLDKWRAFVQSADAAAVHVFNCVLLQNPMCETMMRFGFPEEISLDHIRKISEIIAPMNPVVIYLKNTQIAESVQKTAPERPGWLDAVIDYHRNGAYGKRIAAAGFDGYIRCLNDRQERELQILKQLPVKCLVLEDPQKDWDGAQEAIRRYIDSLC